MTYEGAKATILLEYCGADSCGDCDNCVLGKAIEALEKQTHNCKDCRHADYMKRENVIYCLEHSCMMSYDNCCRDWSDEDE